MSATKLLAALAALTTLGAATPVWSASDPDQITIKVKVSDLNLDNESGARAALGRIRVASYVICGEQPSAKLIQETRLFRACMHRTVGQAVAMANRPVLSALAGARGETMVLAAR
jgi:UrcA family protein